MKVTETAIPGVLLLEPKRFADARGWFMETWRRNRYEELGITVPFTQDNVSMSRRGALRGLHYQWPNPQAKLVSVLLGEIDDVAVDIRAGSPTFGRFVKARLSSENGKQLFIPAGFAHGFVVRSESAIVSYKCSSYYDPAAEGTVLWSDPRVGVPWEIDDPIISEKDRGGLPLDKIPPDSLPRMEVER